MKRALLLILFVVCFSLGESSAQVYYKIDRLGGAVNSNQSNEMAPQIVSNGILFSSNRKSDIVVVTTDQEGNYMYNLYFSEKKNGGNFANAELFAADIKTRFNQSSASISGDGKLMAYTATLGGSDKLGDLTNDTLTNGIFFARNQNDSWVVAGDYPYNSEAYNIAHPFLSEDGQILYFASDMDDGYGGYDIYKSEKSGSRWSKPENLGQVVNTAENEVFPFLFGNNRLYFSSDGHGSQGGVDIFYSDLMNGNWGKPVNMPSPFNSKSDDFAFVASAALDTGYFTSNRRGTDDIYSFVSTFPSFVDCPLQVEENFCYEFYETGTMDLDTTSLKYEWDLGDGTKIRGLQADHCYEEPGYYLVQLNVIDTLTGDVFFSEASFDLVIEKVEQPYMLAPDTASVNENIRFSAAESEIRSFTPEEYYWDFGDGEVSNEIETRHRYEKPGTFIVRLGITGASEEYPDEIQKACVSRNIVIIE